MKEKMKSNSGFTLIELIIAMAILAFLMMAVSSFMSSGVLSFKKAKADIAVHNSAQETYDQLTDSVMQANDVYLFGYTSTADIDFDTSDADVDVDLTPVCYVKGEKDSDEFDAQVTKAKAIYGTGADSFSYESFEEAVDADGKPIKIYVEKLIIDTSVPLELSADTVSGYTAGMKFDDQLTDEIEEIEIKQAERVTNYNDPDDDTDDDTEAVVTQYGSVVYDHKDTLRNTYTFDDRYMYYEKQYSFMDKLNDYYDSSDADDDLFYYMYSKSFSHVNVTGANGRVLTGCVAQVDADNGSIGLDLFFNDKNMNYITLGMVNIRNSYVLKAKK